MMARPLEQAMETLLAGQLRATLRSKFHQKRQTHEVGIDDSPWGNRSAAKCNESPHSLRFLVFASRYDTSFVLPSR